MKKKSVKKKRKSRTVQSENWDFPLAQQRRSFRRKTANWRDPLPYVPKDDRDIDSLDVHPRTKRALKNVRHVVRETYKRLKKLAKRKNFVPLDHAESFAAYGDCRVPGCKCSARPSYSRARFHYGLTG